MESIINTIRDVKNISRSAITYLNGVAAIALIIVSGTSDVDSPEDAVLLRNLSIGFGAGIGLLNLTLIFVIDVLVYTCSDTPEEENILISVFKNDAVSNPDESIVESIQSLLPIISRLKLASNNLTTENINNPVVFKSQIRALENAFNTLGSNNYDRLTTNQHY